MPKDHLRFKLRNNETIFDDKPIGRFMAAFPKIDQDKKLVDFNSSSHTVGIPKYIKIKNHVFKSEIASRGEGQVFIHKDIFEERFDGKGADLEYESATKMDFFLYKLKYDPILQFQIGAILIVLFGTIIDSAFLIGEKYIIFTVKNPFAWLLTSLILKIIGVIFIIKGRFEKEV